MSLSRNRWFGLAGAAIVIGGTAALACGGDDTTPATVKDAGTTKDTGTPTPDTDSGGITDNDGGDAEAPATIYSKLGGHAGISMFVGSVVTDVLTHPEQASYFLFQAPTTAAGHPSAAQIIE